jgi:hypothetical protein
LRRILQITFLVLLVSIAILSMTALYCSSSSNYLLGINPQSAIQDSKIPNPENQTTNDKNQITNSTKPNLVTALGISEVSNTSSISRSYNRLHIEGSVTNSGPDTASNAGIHVVAYTSDRILEINMTYPLTYGAFGSDDSMNSYVTSFDPFCPISLKSLKFGSLATGQTADVDIDIYHIGEVTRWIVTPAYTNNP